ncbi:MAG: PAS domain S-box protein [Pigmentiphaga sp.]|nr:PAS domain S-box protein [Pigmentiphaga sp.]
MNTPAWGSSPSAFFSLPTLFQAIVEQSPAALIVADRQGLIRCWNPRASELFGYTADEAQGQSLDIIIPEHLRAPHWAGYEQAMQSGGTRHGGQLTVTRATNKAGGKVYVEVSFSLLKAEDGSIAGALAMGFPKR